LPVLSMQLIPKYQELQHQLLPLFCSVVSFMTFSMLAFKSL